MLQRPTPQPLQHQIQATSAPYTAACGNTGSWTPWARPGMEALSSRTLYQVLNPLSHHGNSHEWCFCTCKSTPASHLRSVGSPTPCLFILGTANWLPLPCQELQDNGPRQRVIQEKRDFKAKHWHLFKVSISLLWDWRDQEEAWGKIQHDACVLFWSRECDHHEIIGLPSWLCWFSYIFRSKDVLHPRSNKKQKTKQNEKNPICIL